MANHPRDEFIEPETGDDAEAALDKAIISLGKLRSLEFVGDAGAVLHILASLDAQIRLMLPQAVADARDQEYSWAQIGDLLGVTRSSAWERYAPFMEALLPRA